jgi:hypothetical protein
MGAKVNNAGEAIDACGGTTRVARRFGYDVRVVSNWRKRGLPPDTMTGFNEMLAPKGLSAPPSLFRQREISGAAE